MGSVITVGLSRECYEDGQRGSQKMVHFLFVSKWRRYILGLRTKVWLFTAREEGEGSPSMM